MNMLFFKIKAKVSYLVTLEIMSLLVLDCILLPLALFTAVWLRLGAEWDQRLTPDIWLFFTMPLWSIPVFINFGLYRAIIKYLDDKVVYVVFSGVGVTVLILTSLVHIFNIVAFPRTSIVIFGLLALVYIGGSRFLLRGILRSLGRDSRNLYPVVIYGAGDAGAHLASSLMHGSEYVAVAFIDDDLNKWGTTIGGVKVYPPHNLLKLASKLNINKVFLAIPSVGISKRRQIIKKLEHSGLYIQTLPDLNDIINGHVKFSDLKDIDIDDLLGRDIVPPLSHLLNKNIQGKNVLITGGGGSIGSELTRQIAALKPKILVIVDSSEFALYTISQEIATKFSYIKLVDILGSVINVRLIERIINEYKINTIYHAAAYKHVPIVESNPLSGIENNILGTLTVANAAIKYNVENMLLISTDKAVRSTNIMGASKRISELILQALAHEKQNLTVFSIVRFGNVLGSSGSVVPLFKKQIKQGGPITITHPDVTRYFMTITEAVQLVIQASSMAVGGEVFVLDMGEPIKIIDLAHKMIYLSGLTLRNVQHADGDIEIQFTGLRAGEKLHEELLIGNNHTATEHSRIMMANEPYLTLNYLLDNIYLLQSSIDKYDVAATIRILHELVADYQS